MKFKFQNKSDDVVNPQTQDAALPSHPQTDTTPNLYPELRIISLGGTTAVTKNMTVYECGDFMIVVDCGFGFPDSEMLGVDVVLPDISYILERKNKLKAVFITHGHDDHIGAIPFLIRDLAVPIYSTRLVKGLIEVKLREVNALNNVSLKLMDPEGEGVEIGPFRVDYFRVNHSVPDACGISIKTPHGKILHCADFKFDWTPVLDKPFDVAKMTRLVGDEGTTLLLSDCLGATTEGYARSEKSIESTFDELLEKAKGKQVFVTTISSNVSRMAQAIDSAKKHGRRIVLAGRSIEQTVDVAQKLGYLKSDPSLFIEKDKAMKFPQGEILYIIAGAYGQSESAISRISRGEHESLILEEGAYVIFSADPNPPGVREDVDALIDRLTLKNAIVIYSEIQENLHVSGHGLRGDQRLVAALSRAKYFMPIGGTVKHMRAYANMLYEMGAVPGCVFECLEGDVLILRNGTATRGEKVAVSNVFVDGRIVGDVGEKVIQDRNALSQDGIVVVVVPVSQNGQLGKVDIVTRGFVYVKESKELLRDSFEVIERIFNENKNEWKNKGLIKGSIEKALSKFLYKKTGREPLVLVSVVEI
ncbi:MAG: ribonuclease J [Patescibacteria group bacterium]